MPKNTMIIVYLRRRGLVWRVEVEVGLKQGLDPLRGPTMVGAARRYQRLYCSGSGISMGKIHALPTVRGLL